MFTGTNKYVWSNVRGHQLPLKSTRTGLCSMGYVLTVCIYGISGMFYREQRWLFGVHKSGGENMLGANM